VTGCSHRTDPVRQITPSKYPAREQFFRSEQRRNCHRHIEQKTSLCLNLFFSAFLNGPAIDANLDFVAMGALRKNIDRSFEWGG
jgi:hypothetical protein